MSIINSRTSAGFVNLFDGIIRYVTVILQVAFQTAEIDDRMKDSLEL